MVWCTAMMSTMTASGPDQPPAGRLFINIRRDRALMFDRKGYVGVKRATKLKKRSQSLLPASTHPVKPDRKKTEKGEMRGFAARFMCRFTPSGVTHIYTCSIWLDIWHFDCRGAAREGSAWKELDVQLLQTHPSSAAACCTSDFV